MKGRRAKESYLDQMRITLVPSLFHQYRKPLSDPLLHLGLQI